MWHFSIFTVWNIFLGHARNTSPQRCPGRLPSQMSKPPQLGVFDMEESKIEPRHPTEEAHFHRLHSYPQTHSSGHCPELMAIGERKNIDWQLSFHAWFCCTTPDWYSVQITADAELIHMSISRSLTLEQLQRLHFLAGLGTPWYPLPKELDEVTKEWEVWA